MTTTLVRPVGDVPVLPLHLQFGSPLEFLQRVVSARRTSWAARLARALIAHPPSSITQVTCLHQNRSDERRGEERRAPRGADEMVPLTSNWATVELGPQLASSESNYPRSRNRKLKRILR